MVGSGFVLDPVAAEAVRPGHRGEGLERRRVAMIGLGKVEWVRRDAEAALRTRIDELNGAWTGRAAELVPTTCRAG